MAKIPKKVQIGPHRYTVKHDEYTDVLLKDSECSGHCYPDRLEIQITTEIPFTARAETLLHEILHCCWSQTPLRVDEDTSNIEERVVTALSPLVFQILRSNPKLVKYLLTDGED